jgi:hypothetical protein
MISQLQVLDVSECDAVLTRVRSLRERWLDRSVGRRGTFFTLGRAAYLDVCLAGADAEVDYYQAIPANNRMLMEAFADLFERMRGLLEVRLGAPVRYASHLAAPGFHIFLGVGIARAGQASSHFDVQYTRLRLGADPDLCSPISFTLPLRIPAAGSGLDTWNVSLADYENARRRGLARSQDDYAARKVKAYHAYTPGVLVLQEGLILHRLTSPGRIEPEDERITFQGHGLRFNGEWVLYW